jgi:tetratricopeptide (TPR) repeat protein
VGRLLARRSFGLVGLVACVAIAAWVWRQYGNSPAQAATGMLETLPHVAEPSVTDKAVTAWAARARREPRSVLAWANLGDALMQKARETMDLAYYGRAEAAFTQALALNPNEPEVMAGLSWVYGSRHEFERSIEWATKAVKIAPGNQTAYGLLGDAAVEMGDYDAAFKHYQKMLDLRPDLASYSRGAHLLYLTGNTRRAIWLMQKAIAAGAATSEATAWCRAQLALMHWHMGELIPAEQAAEAGLALAPGNYHLLAVMGRIKASRNDYDAAIQYYTKASATAPHHEVVVALGDLYALTGRQDQADRQYALVDTIHRANVSNGVKGDLELARFYVDHDRNLPEALRIAEAEYKLRPNVVAADTLSWCYYKNERYSDAKRLIDKALEHGVSDAAFLFHAGMIEAKLGDRVAAKKLLYQALSLNPQFHPIFKKVASDTLAALGS